MRLLSVFATLGLAGLAVDAPAAAANALDRDRDPVVLAGASLSGLQGAPPGRIVAFRYSGVWVQVPVQVDERAVVDFATEFVQQSPPAPPAS